MDFLGIGDLCLSGGFDVGGLLNGGFELSGATGHGVVPLDFGSTGNVFELAENLGYTADFGGNLFNPGRGMQGLPRQLMSHHNGATRSIPQTFVPGNAVSRPTGTAAPAIVQVYSTTTQQPMQHQHVAQPHTGTFGQTNCQPVQLQNVFHQNEPTAPMQENVFSNPQHYPMNQPNVVVNNRPVGNGAPAGVQRVVAAKQSPWCVRNLRLSLLILVAGIIAFGGLVVIISSYAGKRVS